MAYGGSQARGLIRAVATRATATGDPSCICDLHHSSRQQRILNPLSEARDQTCNLMVPSRIHFRCAITGTPCLACLLAPISPLLTYQTPTYLSRHHSIYYFSHQEKHGIYSAGIPCVWVKHYPKCWINSDE